MKNIKTVLSSPKRIALFAVCAVLIIGLIAFSVLYAVSSISGNQGIGIEKATNVALNDSGFGESEVRDLRTNYDRLDNSDVYRIEFSVNDIEYEYDISAKNGKILMAKRAPKNASSSESSSKEPSQSGAPETNSNSQKPSDSSSNKQPADNSSAQQSNGGYQHISVDKAKEIALSNSGVSSSSASFKKAKLDREDGIYIYEIEFYSGQFEYEYEIDAVSGDILSFDRESIYD